MHSHVDVNEQEYSVAGSAAVSGKQRGRQCDVELWLPFPDNSSAIDGRIVKNTGSKGNSYTRVV